MPVVCREHGEIDQVDGAIPVEVTSVSTGTLVASKYPEIDQGNSAIDIRIK